MPEHAYITAVREELRIGEYSAESSGYILRWLESIESLDFLGQRRPSILEFALFVNRADVFVVGMMGSLTDRIVSAGPQLEVASWFTKELADFANMLLEKYPAHFLIDPMVNFLYLHLDFRTLREFFPKTVGSAQWIMTCREGCPSGDTCRLMYVLDAALSRNSVPCMKAILDLVPRHVLQDTVSKNGRIRMGTPPILFKMLMTDAAGPVLAQALSHDMRRRNHTWDGVESRLLDHYHRYCNQSNLRPDPAFTCALSSPEDASPR